MRNRLQNYWIVGLLITLLSGCTTVREDVVIPQSFLEQPDSIAIVVKEGLNKPYLSLNGRQGIIDVLIIDAVMSEIIDKMAMLPIQNILDQHYFSPFKTYFEKNKFKVHVDPLPIARDLFERANNETDRTSPYDVNFLKNRYDTRYAMILDPVFYGLYRNYYGFIPLGAPRGYIALNFYLVDLDNNSLIATSKELKELSIAGDWDSPPEFVSLMSTVARCLELALNSGYDFLAR